MNHDPTQHPSKAKAFWGSQSSIGLIVLGGIALYFLLTEQRANFFGALPFLLSLACPLMSPILLVMYLRLAVTGEAEMRKQCGAQHQARAAHTPRFLPTFGASATPA